MTSRTATTPEGQTVRVVTVQGQSPRVLFLDGAPAYGDFGPWVVCDCGKVEYPFAPCGSPQCMAKDASPEEQDARCLADYKTAPCPDVSTPDDEGTTKTMTTVKLTDKCLARDLDGAIRKVPAVKAIRTATRLGLRESLDKLNEVLHGNSQGHYQTEVTLVNGMTWDNKTAEDVLKAAGFGVEKAGNKESMDADRSSAILDVMANTDAPYAIACVVVDTMQGYEDRGESPAFDSGPTPRSVTVGVYGHLGYIEPRMVLSPPQD